jgi:hypothetical protein
MYFEHGLIEREKGRNGCEEEERIRFMTLKKKEPIPMAPQPMGLTDPTMLLKPSPFSFS